MKTCTKCHESKSDNLFYFDKKSKRYYTFCNACRSIFKKDFYLRKLDTYKAQAKTYKLSPKGRFSRLKEDSKKRGITLSIIEKDFCELIQLPCYYCDNKLGTKTIYGVGLDRLDSSKPYELSNVVPCCHFCNTIKSYLLTATEMKHVAKLLIDLRVDMSPVPSINMKEDLSRSRKNFSP